MKFKINSDIRKYIKALLIFILPGMSYQACAQYEPQFTQYLNNELFINPAYAGTRGFAAATLLYRDQWVGIE
ncbi:MAG TPA: type IX secretion system membrane protein PorP/SprF, partial [Bacteroidia bacterium]|nr:type IX secretion system membrane protein PorP/SprF [Bacteroidia bacterium]